jgi:phosphoribosylaminoimidazole (AIR) synthetase
MYRVFNMGVGFVAVVASEDADAALRSIRGAGYAGSVIGSAVAGAEKKVTLAQFGLVGRGAGFVPT